MSPLSCVVSDTAPNAVSGGIGAGGLQLCSELAFSE